MPVMSTGRKRSSVASFITSFNSFLGSFSLNSLLSGNNLSLKLNLLKPTTPCSTEKMRALASSFSDAANC